jgi:beta-glucanase (GH16 family)
MNIIFQEDFRKEGRINQDHWNIQTGTKWANNESQCYVDNEANGYIKDGRLHLVATIHPEQPSKYQSARLNTRGKFEYQYGKLTIRAKMPKGRGAWPALWLMGNTEKNPAKWPLCGEIDLVEFAGNRPGVITCAIHTESYNHRIKTDKGTKINVPDASDKFHDYTLDWTKNALSFQIDGKEFFRVDKAPGDTVKEWPFDQPYYLIVNLAVGGWYGGAIVDDDLPYHMEIASIKVEQDARHLG